MQQLTARKSTEAQAIVAHAFEPHTIRVEGDSELDFAFTHKPISKDISVTRLRYGAKVAIDTEELDDIVMVQLPLAGVNRLSLESGYLGLTTQNYSVLSPHQALRQQRAADCDMLILRFKAECIREFLASQIGYVPRSKLTFATILQSKPGPRRRMLSAAVSYLEDEEDLHSSVRLLLGRMLLSIVLLEHPNSYSACLDQVHGAVPRHVKRAEDYIRAHADQPLCTETIATAVGATVRTLQLGFRRFRDCTPTQMLKAVRLDYAHRDLLAAGPGETSVTEIALKWGFRHLSGFAQDYRLKFGEGPSNTLRLRS